MHKHIHMCILFIYKCKPNNVLPTSCFIILLFDLFQCLSWAHAMRHPKTMWLIILLFVCGLVVQYHISTSLIGRPNRDAGSGLSYAEPAVALREELLRAAVGRLGLDDTVSVTIDQKLLHDLMMQLGRELLAVGACGEVSVPTAAGPSFSQVPLTSQKTPRLYIITPTYRRPEQIAELTRMAQTLMHVQNLHWLVIEDAETKTQLVSDLLQRTGISHDHLVGKCACEQFLYE